MSNSANVVADYFCLSHIAAATIPNSRLNAILARMHQGLTLTKHSLNFLQQQQIPGLYLYACGEITHDEYIAGIEPEFLQAHQAAKVANDAKDNERQALAEHFQSRKNLRQSASAAQESERKLRRKREREADEVADRARKVLQAEWKAQRERNCELAAAEYSRTISSGNTELSSLYLAQYFHLEHVVEAFLPPLSELLVALFHGRMLTDHEFAFLRQRAPSHLYQLAFGKLSIDDYMPIAKMVEAEAFAQKTEREAIEAARIAREKDPEYIAMMQVQALYKKYAIVLTDEALRSRMTKLLENIDSGKRFTKDELLWLSTQAKKCFTGPLRCAYHHLEAEFHANEYRRTQNPWNVVNASGHYRKCNQADTALKLIKSVPADRLTHTKIRSALLTTHGGVMRDLGQKLVAIELGESAHELVPRDYRACTLLGAVHMELRRFDKGHEWYEKARALGAPEESIDSELRSIFFQLDLDGRAAMKKFLSSEVSHLYPWLK